MKLVWLIGPHAVGKMTVGQSLAKQTELTLFHNHMAIELALQVLGQRPNTWTLVSRIRDAVFDEALNSDMSGLIFTFMCAFDVPEDVAYVHDVSARFKAAGADVCFVELRADKDIRLLRNKTENRLQHKASKRDIAFSEKLFLSAEAEYRLNTLPEESPFPNMLKIDNTLLSADEVAAQIKAHFAL